MKRFAHGSQSPKQVEAVFSDYAFCLRSKTWGLLSHAILLNQDFKLYYLPSGGPSKDRKWSNATTVKKSQHLPGWWPCDAPGTLVCFQKCDVKVSRSKYWCEISPRHSSWHTHALSVPAWANLTQCVPPARVSEHSCLITGFQWHAGINAHPVLA